MKGTANIWEHKVGIIATISNFVCWCKCRLFHWNTGVLVFKSILLARHFTEPWLLCIYLQLIFLSQVKQVWINWSGDLEFGSHGSVSPGRWRRIKIRSGRVGNEQWIRTDVRVINRADSFPPLLLWPESTMSPNFLSECSAPKVDSTFVLSKVCCRSTCNRSVETLVILMPFGNSSKFWDLSKVDEMRYFPSLEVLKMQKHCCWHRISHFLLTQMAFQVYMTHFIRNSSPEEAFLRRALGAACWNWVSHKFSNKMPVNDVSRYQKELCSGQWHQSERINPQLPYIMINFPMRCESHSDEKYIS